jgi:hypothetical protein
MTFEETARVRAGDHDDELLKQRLARARKAARIEIANRLRAALKPPEEMSPDLMGLIARIKDER